MPTALYFIAILPDAGISREITAFKQYVASHFGSSHALKSPPHITLFPPFKRDEAGEDTLVDLLERFAEPERPFQLNINGFGCFRPRVIYANIAPNKSLMGMQERLERKLEKDLGLLSDRSHTFNPHLTIAHRDLKKELFAPAWAYFKAINYERDCAIGAVALLKHSGGSWRIHCEMPFGDAGNAHFALE